MKKIVIYDGGSFEITLREVMVGAIIVILMITMGFFIGERLSSHLDELNQQYEQAVKIEGSRELFEYGMRTDVGNAFVSGTLTAVDPVSLPEIDGEYAFIRKEEERYTRHTRTVTDYDKDGKPCGSHTEVYYSWDNVGRETFSCTRISFLGHEFDYGTIKFPWEKYLQTIKVSSNTRFLYYVCDSMYYGSIYAKLSDNTVSDSEFVEGKTAEEACKYMCESQVGTMIVFWIFWVLFIGASVYGFFVLDNDWVED